MPRPGEQQSAVENEPNQEMVPGMGLLPGREFKTTI